MGQCEQDCHLHHCHFFLINEYRLANFSMVGSRRLSLAKHLVFFTAVYFFFLAAWGKDEGEELVKMFTYETLQTSIIPEEHSRKRGERGRRGRRREREVGSDGGKTQEKLRRGEESPATKSGREKGKGGVKAKGKHLLRFLLLCD